MKSWTTKQRSLTYSAVLAALALILGVMLLAGSTSTDVRVDRRNGSVRVKITGWVGFKSMAKMAKEADGVIKEICKGGTKKAGLRFS